MGRMKKVLIIILALAGLLYIAFFDFSELEFDFSRAYAACLEKGVEEETGTCLRDLAQVGYGKVSLTEVEEVLSGLPTREGKLWCHEFMHYLGWEHFEATGNLGKAFATASGICDSGMFHGAVEEYIHQSGLAGDIDSSVREIADVACEDSFSSDTAQGVKSNCYHGLGHGFMFITENELPDSLALCDKVEEDFRESCYTGAFMENIQAKQVGRDALHESKYLDPDDPDYPCRILKEHQKEYCYLYQGANNLTKTGGDVGQAYGLCSLVDPSFLSICYRGVGVNIPGPHRTSEESAEACKESLSVGDKAYQACLDGALSFLVQLNLGSGEEAATFCEASEKRFSSECARFAGEALSAWTGEETLDKKCEHFPAGLREACKSTQSSQEND